MPTYLHPRSHHSLSWPRGCRRHTLWAPWLHPRCSGPRYRDRSWSSWPRSQGVPGTISRPQRQQMTSPRSTRNDHRFRIFW